MKKHIIIFVIGLMGITSCSDDFLDLAPENSITSGSFYQTQADFEQALIATYANLRGGFNATHSWVYGEQRSDNCHLTFNSVNRPAFIVDIELADQFLDLPSFGNVGAKWNSLYGTISSANFILSRIDAAELDQNARNSIVGQAKFIRALCYFDLVRYYGGVPLHTEAVENPDDAFLPRTSVEEVYNLILSDATEAVDLLDPPTFPQDGFATKSSARMLLGTVYLTLKRYSDALPVFEAITSAGHNLLPTPSEIYELANKNSVESIFELQYLSTPGLGQANTIPWAFLPMTDDLSPIVGFTPSSSALNAGWCVPTDEMVASYEPGDLRLDATIGVAEGTGTAPIDFVIESLHSPAGYTTPADKTAYRYVKKFLQPHSVANQQDDNFPIFRYAETLLSLAETLNELNRPGEALPYLNQVRSRAGLPDVAETDQSALRGIIAQERRIELAFENKRYLDLVRYGNVMEVLKNYGIEIRAQFGNIGNYILTDGYNFTQDKILLPIPERAIRIGNLEQNPGYPN
ncbi:RagB/SusD family nutrient uptake outer membrane protein [Fulvivirgaceae bacterium BMA12]|uniref:RagB/SusD family nutrient uptake outer membrane protein n=1 Tax=Agaribacillus aureus TaxID=3051825 RepID=A0ABT8L087_9BACT|nr:RagB/SusD family nutrient uptake outer membrane protein [Fulvivirgaceae bacterium BMA12]